MVPAGGEDGLERLRRLAAQRAVGARHLLQRADGAGVALLPAEHVLEDVERAARVAQPGEAEPAEADHQVEHLLVAAGGVGELDFPDDERGQLGPALALGEHLAQELDRVLVVRLAGEDLPVALRGELLVGEGLLGQGTETEEQVDLLGRRRLDHHHPLHHRGELAGVPGLAVDAGQRLEDRHVPRLAAPQLLVRTDREIQPVEPLRPEHRQPPPQLGGRGVGDAALELVLVRGRQLLEGTGLGREPLQLLAGLGALGHLAEGADAGGEGEVLLSQGLAEVGDLTEQGQPVLRRCAGQADLEHLHQVPDVVQAPVDGLEQARGVRADVGQLHQPLEAGDRVRVGGGDGEQTRVALDRRGQLLLALEQLGAAEQV